MKKIEPLGLTAYDYAELEGKAHDKALGNHLELLIELIDGGDTILQEHFADAIGEAERMKTPWFLGEIIMEEHGDEIRSDMEQYFFNLKGDIHPIIYRDDGRTDYIINHEHVPVKIS